MRIPAQQLRLDTTAKSAELLGYKGGARQLLREMAADLVRADGTIRSGYLRISGNGDHVRIQAGHFGSGATAAKSLVQNLVKEAYGEQASQALEAYLSAKTSGSNKIGSQSFVKLIQKLEADTSSFRSGAVDQALNRARVANSARLQTDSIVSLKLPHETAKLLGRDGLIRSVDGLEIDLDEGWLQGLKKLFPESNVSRLGGGGEALAFEIADQAGSRVFKSFVYARDLRQIKAREGDAGLAYSAALRSSPHLAGATHFLMGFGDGQSVPQTVVRVPVDRVKELAKESYGASVGKAGWWVYGLEMPKAAGQSLEVQGRLSNTDLSRIANVLHAGLSDLAAHNAIHNDIKPENVMYDAAGGQVQIIDFGGLTKLSKANAQEGQKPQVGHAIVSTPGFVPPWVQSGVQFGVEQDRYAAAMTLLASSMVDPKDSSGAATKSSAVISEAMADFNRSADQPDQLLRDVLDHIGRGNPAMHRQLEQRLSQAPQLADYLKLMFASAVPGVAGDEVWNQLKGHPFMTAPVA